MFKGVNYKKILLFALLLGLLAFICFLMAISGMGDSIADAKPPEFLIKLAVTVLNILAFPIVFIGGEIFGLDNAWFIMPGFAVNCILLGFLMERLLAKLNNRRS
jgi:hypothetical protein